jgi:hypothetical protein
MMKFLSCVLAVATLAGCASTTAPEGEFGGLKAEEREYTTGSLMPRKRDGSAPKATAEQVQEMQRNAERAVNSIGSTK